MVEFCLGECVFHAVTPPWDAPLHHVALPSAAKKTPAEQQSSYAHVWFRLIGFSNNSTHGLVPKRTTNQEGTRPRHGDLALVPTASAPRLTTKASIPLNSSPTMLSA